MSTLQRDGGTCLLIIDLQVGVVAGCLDAAGVVARTAALVERARASGVPIAFVQHQGHGLRPGGDAWNLVPPLRARDGDILVTKRYRDAFADTTLEAALRARGVTRLVVAGAQSDYCIRTTIQRAAALGYDVTLASDCHTTADARHDGINIGADQIVAHTNLYMSGLRYPHQSCGVATHDNVALRP